MTEPAQPPADTPKDGLRVAEEIARYCENVFTDDESGASFSDIVEQIEEMLTVPPTEFADSVRQALQAIVSAADNLAHPANDDAGWREASNVIERQVKRIDGLLRTAPPGAPDVEMIAEDIVCRNVTCGVNVKRPHGHAGPDFKRAVAGVIATLRRHLTQEGRT